ncbi:putative translocation protein sec62, partial [Toxoplasma gondii p89]
GHFTNSAKLTRRRASRTSRNSLSWTSSTGATSDSQR